MSLYHVPSLRMTQNCTKCKQPLSDPDVGSAEEASVVSKCGILGDPPITQRKTCSKCGRCVIEEVVVKKPRKSRKKVVVN